MLAFNEYNLFDDDTYCPLRAIFIVSWSISIPNPYLHPPTHTHIYTSYPSSRQKSQQEELKEKRIARNESWVEEQVSELENEKMRGRDSMDSFLWGLKDMFPSDVGSSSDANGSLLFPSWALA